MVKTVSNNSVRRGAAYIYLSLVMALVFGLASSSLTARLMSESELGRYRFVISCVSVIASAMTLGMFASAGTLLAGRGGFTFRALVARGASTQAWLVAIGCAIGVGIALAANGGPDSSGLWVLAALLGGAMAWPLLLQEVLRASANFKGLAMLNATPTALFLLLLGGSTAFSWPLNATLCVSLFFVSQGIVAFFLISHYGIAIKPYRVGFVYLFKRNTNLGLNVYWASFLAAFSAQAGIFSLQFVRTPADVAIFSLAVTVSAPLTMLPSAVGTAYFSRLAGGNRFPPNVLRYSWLAAAFLAVCFGMAVPFAVQFLYGDRYAGVSFSAQICGVAAVLHGMGDVYNRFFLANRETRLLLVVAAVVCFVGLIISLIAGLFFGSVGASIARLVASGVYVAIFGYKYHALGR
ncbi:lipopolysaccharide biosynthesis protein [Sphaerotilus montanus]|uniref:lipopolysaccharide biosynthesis protein n=1 Tax=Sphaerotilus montanus TaxID=522889 RepID=UPI003FA20308